MTPVASSVSKVRPLPTHLDLPFEDHTVIHNFFDARQCDLLTSSVEVWIERKRPEFDCLIGEDNYIYWDITTPPTLGAKAPDWFLVPGQHTLLDGIYRNSYVMWQEHTPPTIVMEFLSETPGGESDITPRSGKFWVSEQGINAPHYVIWDPWQDELKAYRLVQGRYQPAKANERGHFPIEELGLEHGLWEGEWRGTYRVWLRFWDHEGNLLLTAKELSEQAQREAEESKQAAEDAKRRAEQEENAKLKAFEKLRELGIDPEKLA